MKLYLRNITNPRSGEYLEYLDNHRDNVIKAWTELLKPSLENAYNPSHIDEVHQDILLHDLSKYEEDEFYPYLNWFYPTDEFPQNKHNYNHAWLKHIHRNPHHWQYWVLVHDNGNMSPLDMDFRSICNMLCDWSSFQFTGKGTAHDWYNDNKNSMILSEKTRAKVEELLDKCKQL